MACPPFPYSTYIEAFKAIDFFTAKQSPAIDGAGFCEILHNSFEWENSMTDRLNWNLIHVFPQSFLNVPFPFHSFFFIFVFQLINIK